MASGLLTEAMNETAYAKIGILGFQGSGKTYTASALSIGLAKKRGRKKVAFFDTEKGSDFLIPRFKENGITLMRFKGRAFTDLLKLIREVEANSEIDTLIIDSISHVWRDLCDSYQKKLNRRRLTMPDWNVLKGQWKDYTDLYVNSKLDIIMLGRAGYEYEHTEDDDGKKEIIKSGTKMKVEGETGYEPDLLLEMDAEQNLHEKKITNVCWVMKDRSQTLNGNKIESPTYSSFEPFWKTINFGGLHSGVNTDRDSQEIFADPDWSYEEKTKKRKIALEEIKEVFILKELAGTSKDDVKKRTEELIKYFGTGAWSAIENMQPLSDLLAKTQALRVGMGVVPSVPPVVTNGIAAHDPTDDIKF